jgi:transposase
VHTIEQDSARRRRRRHSAEFKAELVAACQRPGVSSAAVGLAHSINANLLRRWVAEAERDESIATEAPEAVPSPGNAFVALPIPAKPSTDLPGSVDGERSMAEFCRARVRDLAP